MKPYQYSREYYEYGLPTQIDDKRANDVFFDRISDWGDFVLNVKNGYADINNPDSGVWDIWLSNGEHVYTGRFFDYDDLKPYTGQQWKKHVVAFIWFNAFDTIWWVADDKAFEMFSGDVDWFEK